MDITFHYPADLLSLLIETIPLLCRSKKDLLLFFLGAGVADEYTAEISQRLAAAPKEVSKYEIARTVLSLLNKKGEPALGERRAILRRVTDFDDFAGCWPDDVLKAQGLVEQVRKLVNVKDAFTRMQQERDEESRKRKEAVEREAAAKRKHEKELEDIKTDFFRLFAESNAWKRGKSVESVLNRLFKTHCLLVRDAFTLKGDEGQGVIEQIDGVIDLDGDLYLVEMKWWDAPLGPGDVSQHMVRVFNRGHARGVFIAHPGFTDAALAMCREGLQRTVFVLATIEELVRVVNERAELKAVLKAKVRAAIVEKQPLFRAW